MKKPFTALVLGTLVACLLSSCMSSKRNTWSNPEFKNRKLGKTIVMAIGNSESLIYQYESMFVNGLATYGIKADSIHATYADIDEMERDEIAALLMKEQYDSILVTRVLTEDDRQQMVTTGYTASISDSYWGYGVTYILNPNYGRISNSMEFELETNLFEVKSMKLVWSGRKLVYDDRSDLTNMKKIIRNVISELHANKMM